MSWVPQFGSEKIESLSAAGAQDSQRKSRIETLEVIGRTDYFGWRGEPHRRSFGRCLSIVATDSTACTFHGEEESFALVDTADHRIKVTCECGRTFRRFDRRLSGPNAEKPGLSEPNDVQEGCSLFSPVARPTMECVETAKGIATRGSIYRHREEWPSGLRRRS